jgi:hypothetical protein
MALVDPNEEPRLRLRRRHEEEPFPAQKQGERDKMFGPEEGEGFRSAAAAALGGGRTLPGEVKRLRLRPIRNPSGRRCLYRRRGVGRGGQVSRAEMSFRSGCTALFCFRPFLQDGFSRSMDQDRWAGGH